MHAGSTTRDALKELNDILTTFDQLKSPESYVKRLYERTAILAETGKLPASAEHDGLPASLSPFLKGLHRKLVTLQLTQHSSRKCCDTKAWPSP